MEFEMVLGWFWDGVWDGAGDGEEDGEEAKDPNQLNQGKNNVSKKYKIGLKRREKRNRHKKTAPEKGQ